MPAADEVPDEPPTRVVYGLDEPLTLLAALEDARDALIESGRLALVVAIEAEVRILSRRLGSGYQPPGGRDA